MQPEPCCVPGCYRRAKSTLPFCERCWSTATDEERSGVQFAIYAPFHSRWLGYSGTEVDDVLIEDRTVAAGGLRATCIKGRYWVQSVDHAGKAEWDKPLGAFLQGYEARTTREAVAALIAGRRRSA